MAAINRQRRANAGSKMAALIEKMEKEKDEFYDTLYGGFTEQGDDADYQFEEEIEEDIVDSDFSDTEDEEEENVGKSDQEDEDEKLKRRKKAIKNITSKPKAARKPKDPLTSKPKNKPEPSQNIPMDQSEKQSRMRSTTYQHGLIAQKAREREKLLQSNKKHHNRLEYRRFTQAELLAEAVVTEEENLASLARHLSLEAEKKIVNKKEKPGIQGPFIRYHSMRTPVVSDELVENIMNSAGNNYNSLKGDKPLEPTDRVSEVNESYSQKNCTRNFLSFYENENYRKKYFHSKNNVPNKATCVVTGLPAIYKDPLTGLPYATMEAFKYIRERRRKVINDTKMNNENRKRKLPERSTDSIIIE